MVEGNSDEPRPRAAFDTNPLTPKQTRASFKVIRPQDHGVFVSKREFVLAHKGWVVSVITNSSLLPSTRSSTQRWTVSAVDGWAQPTASAFWCPITTLERLAPKAVAAWTARSQTTPTAHRLRDRKATRAKRTTALMGANDNNLPTTANHVPPWAKR